MCEMWVLLAILVTATSGVAGLPFGRHSMAGQWVSTLLAVGGSALGLAGVCRFWMTGESHPIAIPWSLPGAEFSIALDGLSAIFLLPIFLISLLGAVYGLGYWKQTDNPENGRKLRLFYGAMTAGMALLVVARNGMLFLYGWECMALSAFFLVTTQDDKQDVREAGWIYLVATHVATLSLFGLFALLRAAIGSFALVPLDHSLPPAMSATIFALALVGFGIKAGVMPLHVWLPGAHAAAPSHVSAIMSGVIIKMGVYGLLRVTSLLPHAPLEWGVIVLSLGVLSGVLGVAFAIGQQDLKRLLAYSSIENVGIMMIGFGLALIGRALDRTDWVILGLSGCLLHVLNHAVFKSLLFFAAGSVMHATHTRNIDQLGGLSKVMPRTALCFMVGAVSICALPPLNGFVSEFLLYLGLFDTLWNKAGASFAGAAFAAAALALIGALAVACFVRAYGAVFLGAARTQCARDAHESSPAIVGPMVVLAAICLAIGLAPGWLAPVLGRAVADWAPGAQDAPQRLAQLAPLGWMTGMGLALISALAIVGVALAALVHRGGAERSATWGCGYAAPTARMQYSSSSFSEMLVRLFGWALRARLHGPKELPIFPRKAAFHSDLPDLVLDEAVLPTFRYGARMFSALRVLQQGRIQIYLLYIFLALITLLLWR